MIRRVALVLLVSCLYAGSLGAAEPRGTGDLGVVVERATGSLAIVDTTARSIIARIDGLGDLSHASVVFSRDQRYAFVFGRDGGLTKIDLIEHRIAKRIIQAGNSIGGAISDDGRLVAVSNYEPGGIRVFDAATLDPVADIPAVYTSSGDRSKTVGLVDAPGRKFLFTLYDAGEIWMADFSGGAEPVVNKLGDAGLMPYDALITGDGRHYIAGLFGEDGLAHVDLWASNPAVRRILDGYGKGEEKLPVYKMPHLEGWALAANRFILPAVGRHELLVLDAEDFEETGRVAVHGQPVFAVARPDGRQVWVNFAHPLNDTVQVVDVPSLEIIHEFKPGPAVLHLEFTPRGHEVWISVRDADRVDIYDTGTFEKVGELPMGKPSGIFFTSRANRIGL
ncbi:MAG: protein nirF [Rhizobiales bacterium]|nr:protein nirF [Hyphomicrobiales bacterium]